MVEPSDVAQTVGRHYTRGGLGERILDALAAAGKNVKALDESDLAAVDQFHIGGRRATLELAKLAGIQPGARVLDAGGGLGGPARTLARELRCQVTVVEVTREFVEVGAMLSERMDLSGKVHHRYGDAAEIAFDDGQFDVAWTQHSTMNVADKHRLYEQFQRVLRTHGRLAMHEVTAGPGGEVRFPVPWADGPDGSFLLPGADLRELITRHGFRELIWQDVTQQSLDWYKKRAAPASLPENSLPSIGMHMLVSAEASLNVVRNLEEGRSEIIQAVFERP